MIGKSTTSFESGFEPIKYPTFESTKYSTFEQTSRNEMYGSTILNDAEVCMTKGSIIKSKVEEFPPKESDKLPLNIKEFTKLHPLDAIEKELHEISDLDYPSLESKFVLSNFQLREHKKMSNIVYSKLDTINHHLFERYARDIGRPKSITIAAGRYIAVGTDSGIAVVFDYNQTTPRLLGTNREINFGSITSMDIDSECEYLICGYKGGQLVFWDISSQKAIKTIQGEHKTPILAVKFWKEGKSNIITSDSTGKVLTMQITKGFLSSAISKETLLDGSAGPVCSISIIRKDIVKNTRLKDYTLAALCSPEMVLVVGLEPNVAILFKYERPFDIGESVVSLCAWGTGAIPESSNNSNPLLAMVWGNKIRLLQVNNIHEKDGKGFRPCGYYYNDPKSQNDIVYVGFVSKSLIAVVDSKMAVSILYTGHFEPTDDEENRQIEQVLNKKAVLETHLVDPDLLYQVIKEKQEGGYSVYQNTVFTIDSTRRIFLLAREKMYIGRLHSWEEYIKLLVSKGEWLAALAVCLEIYRGTNKMFADVPSDEKECSIIMKPFFRELISEYINHVGALHSIKSKGQLMTNPNEIWEMVILTTIDFLVSSDNFEFLFIDIRDLLKQYGQLENFISNLEPFILHNKITYIPNKPFREIAAYYSKKGKSIVLEHLIINLNIKSIDEGVTIALCMEHSLIASLVYVCTHLKTPDYITPCCKLLVIYQSNLKEQRSDAKNAGYRCLWYIRLIIQGEKFPQGMIEKKELRSAIPNIVSLIFDEITLRDLLSLDAPLFFELIEPLFRGELETILEEYHRRMIEKYQTDKIYILNPVRVNQPEKNARNKGKERSQELEPHEKYTTIISQDNAKGFSRVHLQMLTALYSCCVNTPSLNYSFAVFMGELIIEKKYPLKVEVTKKLLEILLQNKEVRPAEKTGNKAVLSSPDEDSDEWQMEVNARSQMLIKLMKNFHKSFKKEDFETLLELSELSP